MDSTGSSCAHRHGVGVGIGKPLETRAPRQVVISATGMRCPRIRNMATCCLWHVPIRPAKRSGAGLRGGLIRPAGKRAVIEDVDIEWQHTEVFIVSHSGESRTAERAEQKLVLRYREYMEGRGVTVRRKRYFAVGEVRPIYSDIWVEARRALIEAKNSDSRDAVRQTIGQLYDYRRFRQSTWRFSFPTRQPAIGWISSGAQALRPYGRTEQAFVIQPMAPSSSAARF